MTRLLRALIRQLGRAVAPPAPTSPASIAVAVADAYDHAQQERREADRRERLDAIERFSRENGVESEVVDDAGQVKPGDLSVADVLGSKGQPYWPVRRVADDEDRTGLAIRPRGDLVTEPEQIIVAQRDEIERLNEELANTQKTTAEMDDLRVKTAAAEERAAALQKAYRPQKYPGWRFHRDGKRSLMVTSKAHERKACVPHGEWYESPADAAAARQTIKAYENAPAAKKRLAKRVNARWRRARR